MLSGPSLESLSGQIGDEDRFFTRRRALYSLAQSLEERGSPQGEYIRLELQRNEQDRIYEGLSLPSQRALTLFRRNGSEWKAPLLELGALHVDFQCGVPDQVWISGANFLKHGEELLGTSTVRTIVLRDIDGDGLKLLAKQPWLSTLDTLSLNNNSLTTLDVQSFCRYWKKAGLKELHLQGNWLTDSVLPSLMESAGASGLRLLDLSTNHISGLNVPLTGGVQRPHSLRAIDLSGNLFGNHGGRRVLYHAVPSSVTDLKLNHTRTGNNMLLALAEYRDRLSLGSLGFSGNLARPRGLRELCIPSSALPLQALNLSFNQLTSQNIRKIIGDNSFSHLKGLSLANNVLSSDCIRMMCVTDNRFNEMRRLDCSAIILNGRCKTSLGGIYQLRHLQVLVLRGCGLTQQDAHVLAELEWPPGMSILDLRNNRIGAAGASSLIQSRLWEKGCRILISDPSVDGKLIATARHL